MVLGTELVGRLRGLSIHLSDEQMRAKSCPVIALPIARWESVKRKTKQKVQRQVASRAMDASRAMESGALGSGPGLALTSWNSASSVKREYQLC